MKSLIRTVAHYVLAVAPLTALSAEPGALSADKIHKVVFEVSIDGAEKWQGVLRNVENTLKELGAGTMIEVVTHGKGVGMLLEKSPSPNAELKMKLEQLHALGVVFAACENTMRREKLEKNDLVEWSTTVPSGVSEVVRKQGEGYAYIKSGG